MTFTIDDLPVADELAPGRAGDATPGYPVKIERRSFLAWSAKLLLLVGIVSLGLTTRARRAQADWPNYNEWVNTADPLRRSACGRFDPDFWNGFDGNDNGFRNPGDCTDDTCVGVSDDMMGASFCTQCSERSSQTTIGWHFRGTRGGYTFGDLSPNICNPNTSPYVGSRDAWRWAVASCGSCAPAVFRCHDGYKRYPDGSANKSICQALVGCNGNAYQPC